MTLSEKMDNKNVAGNIYCDRPTDQMVCSSPSWRDNMLSAGKHGGVRSPLSVIGWSHGGRLLTAGELAAKKAARHCGSDIASAKKAVAELIATVEIGNSKENAIPHFQQSSNTDELTSIAADKPISANRFEATDLNRTHHVEATAVLNTDIGQRSEGTIIKQKDIHEDVFDGDDENKENVFCRWNADEIMEISDSFEVDRMVGDTVEQLDKQARTLRRRSQLSTDTSEYEDILQQLKLVRQRQAELERLQMRLRSRLLHCRPASADDHPLNLKLNSTRESEPVDRDVVDRDVVEPLDLRMPSVKPCQQHNNTRVVLADITSKVIGDADPNDCFEIPDSPSAAASDVEQGGAVKDAAEVDGVFPICENFPGNHEGNAGNLEKSGRLKSTPLHSSPTDCAVADDAEKARTVGVLDQYLASLNVSDISDADPPSPAPAVVASPDTSSEFCNYQTYQRSLDVSGRCVDPVAAALFDRDEQVRCLY